MQLSRMRVDDDAMHTFWRSRFDDVRFSTEYPVVETFIRFKAKDSIRVSLTSLFALDAIYVVLGAILISTARTMNAVDILGKFYNTIERIIFTGGEPLLHNFGLASFAEAKRLQSFSRE